jgi:hypothetical protein
MSLNVSCPGRTKHNELSALLPWTWKITIRSSSIRGSVKTGVVLAPRLPTHSLIVELPALQRREAFQSLANVGCRVPARLKNGCLPPYFVSWHPPEVSENSRTFREHPRTFTQEFHARLDPSLQHASPFALPPSSGRTGSGANFRQERALTTPSQDLAGPKRPRARP